MPGSREMFGAAEGNPLAGSHDDAHNRGMFPGLTQPVMGRPGEPTVAQMEAVRYSKAVLLKGFHTAMFRTHKAEDREAYEKLYADIYVGTAAGTISVQLYDKVFVDDGAQSHYLIYLEWCEYELQVNDHMQGDKDVKDTRKKQYPRS